MCTTITNKRANGPRKQREMKVKDIRTEHQKQKDQLKDKIRDLYRAYRAAFPEAKENRLYLAIAEELGMTREGVRGICLRNGITQPSRS